MTPPLRFLGAELQYWRGDLSQWADVPHVVPDAPEEVVADPVNHPAHYTYGGIEVIDAIEAWGLGFAAGNVIKYIARAAHKGREVEDLKKAKWYLERLIAATERGEK